MKTKTILLAMILAMPLMIWADGVSTIIHPSSGSGTSDFPLTGWDSDSKGLFISKDKFVNAEIGNKIQVDGFGVTSDAKLYFGDYDQNPLPGSDFRNTSGLPVYFYLTESMLYEIRNGNGGLGRDLRIYGQNMTVNCVTLSDGKAGHLKYGRTVWTGEFYIDSWKTLELFKQAFDNIDLSQFVAVRFYHEANRTDFVLNIFADDFDHKLADHTNGLIMTDTYAELKLTDELRTSLSSLTTRLYIQGNKESGSAFNLTDVVLVPRAVEGCDNCFYVTY